MIGTYLSGDVTQLHWSHYMSKEFKLKNLVGD